MHLNIYKWTERNPLAQRELRAFPRVVSFIVNWVSSPIAQNSWSKINKKQNKKQNVNFMLVQILWSKEMFYCVEYWILLVHSK